MQDALRPRDGETKEASAARALPHVARRAAELGARLRGVEIRGCEPDDALQRRWRRADDAAAAAAKDRDVAAAEARATRAGDLEHAALVAAAARKCELARVEAQAAGDRAAADHGRAVEARRRAAELAALDAALEREAAERGHADVVAAASRDLELADIAAAKLEKELSAHARRATRGAAAHDETVRFLADLRDKAGVDTGDVLKAPAKEEPPLESRVEALLATALLKARA